jgi:farnesyl diphosphate synthase
MTLATVRTDLNTDRLYVDKYLSTLLHREAIPEQGPVQKAMHYAVLGGGQRIRPILTLRVARVLNVPDALALRAGAAVELLHCASLIVDDLPCMDDSDFRRNQPAVHIKFGEATAVLAAFALVSLAARTVVEDPLPERDRERLLNFQIQLLRSLDCSGLINGQALDLQLDGASHLRTCFAVTELKTVPLFHLAVSAGSLWCDLSDDEHALLKRIGRDYGLAFQMTDDLLDGETVNLPMLDEKLATLRALIAPFGARCHQLEGLLDFLHARIADTVGK